MFVQHLADNLHCKEAVVDLTKLSRNGILLAAFLSFLLSVYLWFYGSKEQGLFVGLWVPSILSFGAFYFSGRKRS
jgi:hypothetical protein